MATAQTLINDALELLGVIGAGETATGEDTTSALGTLNRMLDSWRNESLMVYAISNITHTLVGSDDTYTIGPSGADITATRPVKIESAFVRQSNTDYPVQVIDDQAYWQGIASRTSSSDIPAYLYYDTAFPNGTIYLWPVPFAANVLYMQVWTPLSEYATAGTAVSLPPGYQEAIAYGLAVRLAPKFGIKSGAMDIVMQIARESKADIKRRNQKPLVAQIEFCTGRKSDIYAGY